MSSKPSAHLRALEMQPYDDSIKTDSDYNDAHRPRRITAALSGAVVPRETTYPSQMPDVVPSDMLGSSSWEKTAALSGVAISRESV